jgi:hypothetical protein
MLDYSYKDFQLSQGDINLEEFVDLIWQDNVSEKVVSSAYYAENEDFILACTYDIYRLFQNSDITIRIIARMFESFFFNLFRYKGDNFDVEN